MKKNKVIIFRLLLILPFMVALTSANGTGDKFTRTISKEFTIGSDAHLYVDNKYGTIHCANWDRKAVSLEVTISVDAASEQKAARIFDMIDVKMQGSASEVVAETEISDMFKGNNDNVSIKIDYMINMPGNIAVSLENRFGDIYIENVQGPADIDLSYGNMEAKSLLNNDNELEIKFSKASVETITGFTADIKYSEFIVNETRKMDIESKFSTVRIERVTAADIDSQYDTFTIGDMQTAEIHAEFSTLKIAKLLKHAGIDSKYGALQVKYIAPGFDEVRIYNQFGSVELGVDEEASYQLDATIKLGSLSYPKDKASVIKNADDPVTQVYHGVIGDAKSSASKIYIDSANAGVTIKAW